MNKLVERKKDYPGQITDPETEALATAAQEDAGFERMLKFKKGEYYCDGEVVPLGSKYVAHIVGWTKCWIRFQDGGVSARMIYRQARGEIPPERETLGETEISKWPLGLDGRPNDPWVLQYLVPMEDEAGDVCIFVTSSFGGRRAIGTLVNSYARKKVRVLNLGQPIVALQKMTFPSKKFGDVPRPHFEIVGWDNVNEGIREVKTENLKDDDMDDEIPF